jgi:integrative and conjugative element protein (TIGR02256 family)
MCRGVIQITAEALAAIRTESLASSDGKETGGILLGHEPGDPERIVIATAGDPGPGAHRSRSDFQRDLAHAKNLADAAYLRDQSVWVGEWHTHPRGPVCPSDRDLRTYRRFLLDPELHFIRVASLIITCKDDEWDDVEISGWSISLRSTGSTQRLAIAAWDVTPLASPREEDSDDTA